MPTVYGSVDLVKNELRNAVMQNLGSAPSSPVKGLMYFNSADNTFYWYDGTTWIAAKGAGALSPAVSVTTQAVGDAAVVGSLTSYAREDHKHGREAFAAITAQTTFGQASSNGVALTLPRSDHVHGTPTHDNAAHAAINRSALAVPTADVPWGGFKITGLGTPTAGTDASTKAYVDAAISGLAWKDTVRCASTASVNIATGTLLGIDGVSTAAGDRVLLKNQTAPAENGIYLAATGAWTRAADALLNTDLLNAAVFVSEGTLYADTAWVMTTNMPITVGTTAMTWVQFAGSATYVGGAGLTLTGNTFDVGAGTGILVAADTVAVDTSVIATVASVTAGMVGVTKKFAAALTGTASPETVTHNLNTRDICLQVYNGATPYTAVQVDWDATTVNTAVVRYNPNLGAGYRVVVFG